MTSVAIMQPTYLPWHGYFALMSVVDIFVLLDDVQFNKRSWQQRNRIKTQNGTSYLTVPVFTKDKRDQLISEVLINRDIDFVNKHLKSIQHNYSKAKYFDFYFRKISEIYRKKHLYLSKLNIDFILLFMEGQTKRESH